MRALKWLGIFGTSNIALLVLARLAAEIPGGGGYAAVLMPIANLGFIVAVRLARRPPFRSLPLLIASDVLLVVALDVLLFVLLLLSIKFPQIPT